MRVLRSPLLHFLVIGAALYVASVWRSEPPGEVPIVISIDRVATLRSDWLRQMGRPPSESELASLVDRWVDEELLVREAVALGWHRSDPVIHQRLLRNQRFLEASASEETSDAELLEAAYEMGMDQSDLVVRRRLVSRAKLAIGSRVRANEPTDAELADYLERHGERFQRPAERRLTHVYLSRDRRGASLREDAAALLETLRREDVAPEEAALRGDAFLVPSALSFASRERLAAQLGGEFALAVEALPLQRWSGPVPSSYGLHLVWVHEQRPSELPALYQIRKDVRAELLAEREDEALRDTVAALRARADLRFEEADAHARGAPQ